MKKGAYRRVYQFKIILEAFGGPIWRRIQVPETYSFWDLHVAVQDTMGWLDQHLHRFELVDPATGIEVNIGVPYEDFEWQPDILAGWKEKITHYFSEENHKALYFYDYFNDNWEHLVILEKIVPRQTGVRYPICLGGERACPPEGCGGIHGYRELLEAIANPRHSKYQEKVDWIGQTFEPRDFKAEQVSFDDPHRRLKTALAY